MTENHDAFDAFLAAETEKQVEAASAEAEIALLNYAIADELELHGAVHIWHPDEDERSTRVKAAFETNITKGVSASDTELAIQQRMISETTVITLLQFIKAAEEADPNKDFITNKKDILVQVRLRALGEGWEAAISSLLDGVVLDLDDEMQYLLPGAVVQDRDEIKPAKPVEIFKRILGIDTSQIAELNQDTLDAMETLKIVALTIGVSWGARTLQKRANAESRLYELLADGRINQEQLRQLVELLDKPLM